jgi:SAM-dependent methyltransferase
VDSRSAEWDQIAQDDPEWAILSDPSKRHGKWSQAEFFATGAREISALLEVASAWHLPAQRGDALDFGCGVGRTARALAGSFERVLGLDASTAMVARAREVHDGVPGLSFERVRRSGLEQIGDAQFDLVYCKLVLQHVTDDQLKRSVVANLVRILAFDGLLVLQVPTSIPLRRRLQLRPRLYSWLRRLGLRHGALYRRLGLHPIRMSALDERIVDALVLAGGGRTVRKDTFEVGTPAIEDRIYWVTKSR